MTLFNSDPEKFTYLFDLAGQQIKETPPDLSQEEKSELKELELLLDRIDTSWQVIEPLQDRVQELFIQKLAAKNPNHPLLRRSIVETLGELVKFGSDEIPNIPLESYNELSLDATPIKTLLDNNKRTMIIGQVLKRASVPSNAVGDFMLWLNRALSELIAPPGQNNKGMIFTRKQKKQVNLGKKSDK